MKRLTALLGVRVSKLLFLYSVRKGILFHFALSTLKLLLPPRHSHNVRGSGAGVGEGWGGSLSGGHSGSRGIAAASFPGRTLPPPRPAPALEALAS